MNLTLLFLFFITSCSSIFKSVNYAPENLYPKASTQKALVYFMHTETFAGSSAKWIVTETRNKKEQNIGIFSSGSYFFIEAQPGEVTYQVVDPGWKHVLGLKTLYLERGKTYYLNLKTEGEGFGSQRIHQTGLYLNNSLHLRDELESMRMVDLKACEASWKE